MNTLGNAVRSGWAIDRNQNQMIEPNEVLSSRMDLKPQDRNGDGTLVGAELTSVYMNYDDPDYWIPASGSSFVKDGWRQSVRIDEIDYTKNRIDIKVQMSKA